MIWKQSSMSPSSIVNQQTLLKQQILRESQQNLDIILLAAPLLPTFFYKTAKILFFLGLHNHKILSGKTLAFLTVL